MNIAHCAALYGGDPSCGDLPDSIQCAAIPILRRTAFLTRGLALLEYTQSTLHVVIVPPKREDEVYPSKGR